MFGRLVFKAAAAGCRWCQLHFPEHVGIESVVARAYSHDHSLLPPLKEVEVIPLSALPRGCSDEGLLFLQGDTVVLLSSFGSRWKPLYNAWSGW